jgi:hypothetical protein
MASTNPTQHLNTLLLMYAGQLAAEGDVAALKSMGFRNDHILRFGNLNLFQMATMARSLKGRLIDAKVDPEAVDALFRISERASKEKEVELALVKAGASQKLMARLSGLTLHQYVALRDHAGVKHTDVGRRGELDEAAAGAVWQCWQSLGWMADEARRYLAVHAATNVLVRDIEATLKKNGIEEPQAAGEEDAPTDGAWFAYTRALTGRAQPGPGEETPGVDDPSNTTTRHETDGA